MKRRSYEGRPPVSSVVFPTLPADTFAGAVCHQEGPDLWEPARDGESEKAARGRWRVAAELCGSCPALVACGRLADAQSSLAGVWAGLVPGRVYTIGPRSGCGSAAGYQAHRRHGEDVCVPCSDAHREYMRAYMAGRRAGR